MTEQEVLDAIAKGRVTYNWERRCYEMDGENIHKWARQIDKKDGLVTNSKGVVRCLSTLNPENADAWYN